jgi:16S rRNA (guanine(966)-N(2))-methyltransferase RsmD
MRIISGISKGKKLRTLRGQAIRPTSDRVKESIFNILGQEVEGKHVLDLFAGTGNLGIEALSRGAVRAVFVEKEKLAIDLIKKNLSHCGFDDRSRIITGAVERAIRLLRRKGEVFDLIFMDPPYQKGLVQKTLDILHTQPLYHEDSILVIEHDRREPLSESMEEWVLVRKRQFRDTVVSFIAPSGQRLLKSTEP